MKNLPGCIDSKATNTSVSGCISALVGVVTVVVVDPDTADTGGGCVTMETVEGWRTGREGLGLPGALLPSWFNGILVAGAWLKNGYKTHLILLIQGCFKNQ